MKKRIIFVCAIVLLALVSCGGRAVRIARYIQVHSNNFVGEYIKIQNLRLVRCDSVLIVELGDARDTYVNIFSKGEDKQLFDSLAAKHHDTTYDGEIFAWCVGWLKDPAPSDSSEYNRIGTASTTSDIDSIIVTCAKSWDVTHPEGSSLNDITHFIGWSPYPFILSGYDQSKGYVRFIDKRLSEMVEDDFIMALSTVRNNNNNIAYSIYDNSNIVFDLKFESLPAMDGIYPLQINMFMDDGTVFELNFDWVVNSAED